MGNKQKHQSLKRIRNTNLKYTWYIWLCKLGIEKLNQIPVFFFVYLFVSFNCCSDADEQKIIESDDEDDIDDISKVIIVIVVVFILCMIAVVLSFPCGQDDSKTENKGGELAMTNVNSTSHDVEGIFLFL